jgi:hypothetical protein
MALCAWLGGNTAFWVGGNRHQQTQQHSVEMQFPPSSRVGRIQFTGAEATLSGADLALFEQLVRSDDFYRVRFVATEQQQQQQHNIQAAVPARHLQSSGFRETMRFHADVYGNLVAVDYDTPVHDYFGDNDASSDDVTFRSRGSISLGRVGERPKHTKEFQQKQSTRGGAGKKGGKDAVPPKSFLQKYWMYLGTFCLCIVCTMYVLMHGFSLLLIPLLLPFRPFVCFATICYCVTNSTRGIDCRHANVPGAPGGRPRRLVSRTQNFEIKNPSNTFG